MARFYGKVGYATPREDPEGSGNWVDRITEVGYTGDVLRDTKKDETVPHLTDDISTGTRISIMADNFAVDHFHKIKYVGWMGSLWKVTSVEYMRPRLILSLGSVYNGPTP